MFFTSALLCQILHCLNNISFLHHRTIPTNPSALLLFLIIFHADFPSIASGLDVAFLDPLQCNLDTGDPGTRIPLAELVEDFPDQAAPYAVLSCDPSQASFQGTLFRFPLRHKVSDLSDTIYTPEKVRRQLFDAVGDEGGHLLLFLTNVRRLELHQRVLGGPTVRTLCIEDQATERVDTFRQQLAAALDKSTSATNDVVEIHRRSSIVLHRHDGSTRSHGWSVTHQLGTRDRDLQTLAMDKTMNFHVWVGVAMPVQPIATGARSSRVPWLMANPRINGLAFCFLPLPIPTGLPAHVHGYFAVNNDRRGIKWPSNEEHGKEAKWNKLLVEHALASAYISALSGLWQGCRFQAPVAMEMQGDSDQCCAAYVAWPDATRISSLGNGPWLSLLRCIRPRLFELPLLYSHAQHGRWLSVAEAWLMASDASASVALPGDVRGSQGVSANVTQSVYQVLLALNEPVVLIPPHVWRTLHSESSGRYKVLLESRTVKPGVVRQCLHNANSSRPGEVKAVISVNNAMSPLLAYVTHDLQGSEVIKQLHGLPLIPTCSPNPHDRLASVGKDTLFLQNIPRFSMDLVPGLEAYFVDTITGILSREVEDKLRSAAISGQCLRVLDRKHVLGLLPASIRTWDPSWKTGQATQWLPSGHPGETWLGKLWHWLDVECSQGLSEAKGLPLLPVGNGLAPLRHPSNVLIYRHNHLPNDAALCLLTSLGCKVLLLPPSYLRHHQLSQFTCELSPDGVVSVLHNLACLRSSSTVIEHVATASDEQKLALLKYISFAREGHLREFKSVLRQLPIIPAVGVERTIVSISKSIGHFLPLDLPQDLLDVPFPACLLVVPQNDHRVASFLGCLGCSQLSVDRLLVEFLVQHGLSSRVHQPRILEFVVQQLQRQTLAADTLHQLSQMEFVPRSESGTLCRPSSLFDPNDPILSLLLEAHDDVYPADSFISVLEALRKMGLKRITTLSSEQKAKLAEWYAKRISGNVASLDKEQKHSTAVKMAKNVLVFIVKADLHGSKVKALLRETKWLPAMPRPKSQVFPPSLEWCNDQPGGNEKLFSASEIVRGSAFSGHQPELLIGSEVCLCSREVDNLLKTRESLAQQLGFSSQRRPDLVVAQLLRITKFYRKMQSQSDHFDSTLVHQVHTMCTTIYGYLTSLIESRQADIRTALSALRGKPCVWFSSGGTGFIVPQNVVFSLPDGISSLQPYFWSLDMDLHRFSSLFKLLGVRERLDFKDLAIVLTSIHEEVQDGILSDEQTMLCLSILRCKVVSNATTTQLAGRDVLLVPTAEKKLLPATDCTYRDGRFWKSVETNDSDEDDDGDFAEFNLVHSDLSTQLAKKYSVPPLSTKILPSTELDLQYEKVGQHEPLTTRLRDILRKYPNDVTVLKELVQNADDAGAKEVKFMLDMRQATPENSRKLLHENMRAWQGPALWVYNDASFSEDDFRNIMLLGGGTKRTTPGKIGRFGLGFCSVYHLTDVPSFVSADSVVFLDPQCTNLEGRVRSDRPGMRIKFTEQQKGLKAFRDQFSLYTDIFGCRVLADGRPSKKYNHTLFRFPLRSSSHPSDISHNDALQTCPNILKELEEAASELVLFLQHVEKVSIWHLSVDAASPSEARKVFSVSAKPTEHVLGDQHCAKLLPHLLEVHGNRLVETMTKCTSNDLPWTAYTKTITMDTYSVSHERSRSQSEEEWLLCSSFGGGNSVNKALSLASSSSGAALLPWTGVACRLKQHREGYMTAEPSDGRVFCFLPLPRSTGLPVHVNGFFSVRSDRKGLDDEEHSKDVRVLWNHCLTEQVLPRTYLHFLKALVKVLGTQLHHAVGKNRDKVTRSLYSILPGAHEPNTAYWVRTSRLVMNLAVQDPSLAILWTEAQGGQWLSVQDAVLLDSELASFCETAATQVLIELDQNIVRTSSGDGLQKSLQLANISECFTTFKDFFNNFFFENIDWISGTVQDELVRVLLAFMARHMSSNDIRWCAEKLNRSPCVLSSNGQRRRPSELIELRPECNELKHLFSEDEGRYLDSSLEQHLPVLRSRCNIISRAEDLSREDVLDRARSIQQLRRSQPIKAFERVEHFVRFLSCTKFLRDARLMKELRSIAFLPVLPKPEKWPFQWAQRELFSSADLLLPQSWGSTVGSVIQVVDETRASLHSCRDVYRQLGFEDKEPQMDEIIGQLSILKNSVAQQHQYNDITTMCIQRIYTFFQKHAGQLQANRSGLPDSWIWEEKTRQFLPVKKMRLAIPDGYGGLMPYRSLVPFGESFRQLFSGVGVRRTVDSSDLLEIMREVEGCLRTEKRRLNQSELQLVVRLVGCLCQDPHFDQHQLLLPTNDGRLLRAEDCTYCDRKFLRQGSDELIGSDQAMENCVHKQVEHWAEKLGAVPLSQRLLPSEAVELDFEQVGQYEDLTTRLRNILDEYPGDSILKEMLQNADDAGATEVCFVLDWRRHGCESLLHPAMAPWQGPALLAYNNAKLTPKDFENIMKLGGGTKKQDLGKIGRFGLGFCSVYHLTDVPSFVSGDKIVILDPHTTNLKNRVSKLSPGIQINFVKERGRLQNFSDQFVPYNGIFGCDLWRKPYEHTLFRLPLRQSCSEKNLISDEVFNQKSMLDMVKKFWKQLPQMLLFLQSVKRVTVFEIHEQAACASDMVELFSTNLSMSLEKRWQGSGRDYLRQLHEVHKDRLVDELRKQRQGPSKAATPTTSCFRVVTKLSADGQRLLKRLEGRPSSVSETWLVSSSAGNGKAIEICCRDEGRKAGLVPWGSCGVRLSSSEQTSVDCRPVDGSAFCFLPLPISTGLPVHVNACFAVASNRQSLEATNDESFKVAWNRALVSDILPQVYLNVIRAVISFLPDGDHRLLHLLFPPPPKNAVGFWAELSKSFYAQLFQPTSLAVLWSDRPLNGSNWISGSDALLLVDHEKYRGLFDDAVMLTSRCGFYAIEQPENLQAAIGTMCFGEKTLLRFRKFCENILVKSQQSKQFEALLRLVLDCSRKDRSWCQQLIREKNVLPTSTGVYVKATRLIDRDHRLLSRLFIIEDGRFPALWLSEFRHILQEAGMAYKKLSSDDVLERARSISKLYLDSPNIAMNRVNAFLQYLASPDAKVTDLDRSVRDELRSVAFLPVAKAPDNFHLPWMGIGQLFTSCDQAYIFEKRWLLGSTAYIINEHSLGLSMSSGK